MIFREAIAADIPALKFIRDNVRENALVNIKIEISDYEQALFRDGKGWVCIVENEIVGFSCGRLKQKDVWALFIKQEYEGKGIGNKLMELLENWMFENGCSQIALTTAPGTRAEKLYLRRGWILTERLPNDLKFILKCKKSAERT